MLPKFNTSDKKKYEEKNLAKRARNSPYIYICTIFEK